MRTAAVTAKIILWLVFPNAVSSINRGGVHHDHLQHQMLSTLSTSTSYPHAPTNEGIAFATLRHRAEETTEQTIHITTHLTSIRDAITRGVPIALLSHSHTPIDEQSTTETEDYKASQSQESDVSSADVFPPSTAIPDTMYSQPNVVSDSPDNVQIDAVQENELSDSFHDDVVDKISAFAEPTTDQAINSRSETSRIHDSTRHVATDVTIPNVDGKQNEMTSWIPSQRQRTPHSLTHEFIPGDSDPEYDSLEPGITLPNIVKKIGDALPTEKHTIPDATGSLQTESSAASAMPKSTESFPETTSAAASQTPSTSYPSVLVPTPEYRPIKVQKKSDIVTATVKELVTTLPTGFEVTQQSGESSPTVAQYVVKLSTQDTLLLQGTEASVETLKLTTDSPYVEVALTNYTDLPTSTPSDTDLPSPTSTADITATAVAAQVSPPADRQDVHDVVVKVDEQHHNSLELEGKVAPKATHPQERLMFAVLPGDMPEHPQMFTDSPLIVQPDQGGITEIVDKVKPQKPIASGATEGDKEQGPTTAEGTIATETSQVVIKVSPVSTQTSGTTGTNIMISEPSTDVQFNESSATTEVTTAFDSSTQTEHTTEGQRQADCLRLQTGCMNPSTDEPAFENSSNDTSTTDASIQAEAFPDVSFCITITLSGTWDRFCSEIEEFRRSIAEVLSLELRPDVSPRQIVIEDNCSQNRRNHGGVVVRMHLTDTEERYSQKLTALAAVILHHNDRQHINLQFLPQMMNVCFYSSKSVTSTTLPKKALHNMSSTGVIASITISAIAGTSLFLISVLLVVMRQRIQHTRGAPATADGLSLASFKSSFRKKKIRQSLRSFLNEAFDDNEDFSKPVSFNSLPAALSNKDALEEEFKRIPMNMARVDDMPQGVERKNRYANVIPIPETKVLLSSRPDDDTSGYINANFVRGYKGRPQRYIACQAPLPETTEDFWRMIWEQQCKVILMLTACEENGVQRCAPYFPVNTLDCHKLYGDHQVTLLSKDVMPSFTFSTFKLHHLDKNLCREVYHCWYTAWPPQGVPEDVSSVVTFLLEARQYTSRSSAPIVVHCSPGTGRAGTVLAIDICMQELEDKHRVDVPRTVFRLRQDRGGAVQTKDQYAFIYEALYDCSARIAAQSKRPSVVSTT